MNPVALNLAGLNPASHQLPAVYLLLLPLSLALFLVGLALLLRIVRGRQSQEEERDWSIPALDGGQRDSLFGRWDVRCKLLTLLIYAFMVASLQQLGYALLALLLSALAVLLARTPLARVLKRLLAISGFMVMFLVVMPFSAPAHPGDVVLVFGGLERLPFNLRGLALAATLFAKGVAIALLSEPLLGSAPLPVTLQGLSQLGAPQMCGQLVMLSHRYIHVFSDEARRMATGMQVRGFRKRTSLSTLRALANFLGMLLVRSFERTERVVDAMRARGYRGHFPAATELQVRATDLLLSGLWLLLGIGLVVADRWG
jgi:cobalt/nickel transport system permease protein